MHLRIKTITALSLLLIASSSLLYCAEQPSYIQHARPFVAGTSLAIGVVSKLLFPTIPQLSFLHSISSLLICWGMSEGESKVDQLVSTAALICTIFHTWNAIHITHSHAFRKGFIRGYDRGNADGINFALLHRARPSAVSPFTGAFTTLGGRKGRVINGERIMDQ